LVQTVAMNPDVFLLMNPKHSHWPSSLTTLNYLFTPSSNKDVLP